MKTREEQIEEMVEIMCDDFGASFFAERLYDAGYRKQSDTVREFVEKIEEVALQMRYEASRVYQARNQSKAQFAFGEKNAIENLMQQINALAVEYGAEVEE